MRDPDRIYDILSTLQLLWEKYPDLRLGQLICNCTPPLKTMFYVEDDVVHKKLQEFLQNGRPSP